MIFAIDIETIPNEEMKDKLPEPKIDSRLKDAAKIAAATEKARAEQIDKMALNPITARVCCYGSVGVIGTEENEYGEIISEATDEAEATIIQSIMRALGADDVRIVTWNGIGFDMPMIYKRAMMLGVDPANFDAPPLTAWTKRYNLEKHYDLMQIWSAWERTKWAKLEDVARVVLDEEREDIPYAEVPDMIKTDAGRAKVKDACINHTRLTWELWERFNGFLFA